MRRTGWMRAARHAGLGLLLLASAGAQATSLGQQDGTLRPGDNGSGCAGCHGSAGVVSVAVSGPGAMLPGATARYAVTVGNVSNAAARVGFTAAITKLAGKQPTFATVAGEPEGTSDGATQIRHSNFATPLKTPTAGSATYLVDLSMPANADIGQTYTVYSVGNAGHSATQVGWNHGAAFPITVAPPTPTALTPDQANATTTQIALSWAGTQGEHFRVLRKSGSFPTSATDAGATLVYEGNLTSGTATGLSAGTLYFFAVYGKVPAVASYSSAAAQATAATRPPSPASLSANGVSSAEIGLSWTGTSAQYRVLGKAGSFPASPTDGSAKLVYEGALTSTTDTGLAAGTSYFYRVWGKTAGAAVYSSGNAQASAATAAQPTPRFVDAASGSDGAGSNDCASAGSPCRTITHAMGRAGSGDVISVAPGVYDVALGEVFPITFKSGVQLQASGALAATVIDGDGDSVARGLFSSTGNSSALTALRGFTVRRGLNTPEQAGVALGGALFIQTGSAGTFTIEGNVFEANEARGYTADGSVGQTGGLAWGGAVAVFSSNVVIRNNLFVGNQARGGGGQFHPGSPLSNNESGGQGLGGAVYFAGTGSVVNNTFVSNVASGGDGGIASNGVGTPGAGAGGAISATGNPAPSIDNNVFANNLAQVGAGPAVDLSSAGALSGGAAAVVRNNLFFGNRVDGAASSDDELGSAAVLADPVFHSATSYRLRNASPARGAALAGVAPAQDLAGATRPQAPAIGAFEASLVPQAIVPGPAPTLSVGGSAMVSASIGGSGNPLQLGSQTPATCSVAGSTVSGLAAGTCTLNLDQAGNSDFAAAPTQALSFPVLAGPSFALSVSRDGSGSGRVQSLPAGIDCGASCAANFAAGSTVVLVASADAGSAFAGWSGAGCSGTGSCSVTVNQARAVTASFTALTRFAVSLSGAQEVPPNAATGSGRGSVSINPVDDTLDYAFTVEGLSGALVGAHFHGPAARGVNAAVKINLGAQPFAGTVGYAAADEAALLGGQWYVNYHTGTFPGGELRGQLDTLGGLFTVSVGVQGSGAVTSSPAGIDCGSSCLGVFAEDATVTLTAMPGPQSEFVEWLGHCAGSGPLCALGVDAAKATTARFRLRADAPVLIFRNSFE